MAENCVYWPMSGPYRTIFAARLASALIPVALIGASASARPDSPDPETDPMRFFEGKTVSLSTIKLIMRRPYRSRTIGDGEIDSGTLNLVQRVHEDGKAPYDRKWRMRQVAPGRFTGTMSEAKGPVTAEEFRGRYRFRFKMRSNMSIEQWLTPLPGGKSARSRVTIRKLGMTVGRSDGVVRKL